MNDSTNLWGYNNESKEGSAFRELRISSKQLTNPWSCICHRFMYKVLWEDRKKMGSWRNHKTVLLTYFIHLIRLFLNCGPPQARYCTVPWNRMRTLSPGLFDDVVLSLWRHSQTSRKCRIVKNSSAGLDTSPTLFQFLV